MIGEVRWKTGSEILGIMPRWTYFTVPKSPGTIKRDAINHGGESEKGGYLLPRAPPVLVFDFHGHHIPLRQPLCSFSIVEDTSPGADEDKTTMEARFGSHLRSTALLNAGAYSRRSERQSS